MKADGRFGGHIVQGHVDGVGKLIGSNASPTPRIGGCTSNCLKSVEKYTVYKGSISIEGISLTVATPRRKIAAPLLSSRTRWR